MIGSATAICHWSLSLSLPPPTVADVARIAAIPDPVLRNLEITLCYSRLSAAMAARTGACSNWCTFATWASRQAGATIRGEDLLDALGRRLGSPGEALHPIRTLWRALLRRGVFRPATRLGRIVRAVHSPFDAFERTSDAVARGNLKVFEEIGREFARFLADCAPDSAPDSPQFARFLDGLSHGEPPEGQAWLRRAFMRYQEQRFAADPARRAELIAAANLEIGFHEQTRLQPEIRESLDAPLTTARDLKGRLLDALLPARGVLRALAGRGPIASLLVSAADALRTRLARVSREVITECLMVLALPGGTVLRLGRALDTPIPEGLRSPSHPDLGQLLKTFERCAPSSVDAGAEDWSELRQRMHYILHLFCAFNERSDLFAEPFTVAQIEAMGAGRLPEGRL
jgi:hypothetical protein